MKKLTKQIFKKNQQPLLLKSISKQQQFCTFLQSKQLKPLLEQDIYQLDDHKIDINKYKTFNHELVYHHDPKEIEINENNSTSLNLCNSINVALKQAMEKDPNSLVFGEDVAFGGVFRCTVDLREQYSVYNR
ncbi:hypothetical protein ABK040_016338 [Willaertia magna]